MALFTHENRQRSERTKRLYAAYKLAHTCVDFAASLCFLAGSILFFWPADETPAVWLFVIGSAFFCCKPTLRLVREVHLWRRGRLEDLAKGLER